MRSITPRPTPSRKGGALVNPKNKFYSFFEEKQACRFPSISMRNQTEVFFGIGVRPDLCGRGFGWQMTQAACELSGNLFPGKSLYLEVRTWNEREPFGVMKKRAFASRAADSPNDRSRRWCVLSYGLSRVKRTLCMTSACGGFCLHLSRPDGTGRARLRAS